jgi:hypothetical protein
MIIWQFLTENVIQGGLLFFGRIFFWPKSQLLTLEMDSKAKTKYKRIMQYFFLVWKIKSFVPIVLGKTVKYHVPNKRLPSDFFSVPLQQWATLIRMEKKFGYNWKQNFSPEWNMIIWQFLTESFIQGGKEKKVNFLPRKWTLGPKQSIKE